MHLQILEAKILEDHETFGEMDPFVKVKVGKQEFKTKVAEDAGKNPKWQNEIFKIPYNELEKEAFLELWEYDSGSSNDYLGSCQLNIAEEFAAKSQEKKMTLNLRSFENNEVGQLLIEINVLSPKVDEEGNTQRAQLKNTSPTSGLNFQKF